MTENKVIYKSYPVPGSPACTSPTYFISFSIPSTSLATISTKVLTRLFVIIQSCHELRCTTPCHYLSCRRNTLKQHTGFYTAAPQAPSGAAEELERYNSFFEVYQQSAR